MKIQGIVTVFIFILLSHGSCITARKYNALLQQDVSPGKLVKDISVVQKKLHRLHPDPFRYISKSDLDRKFDSLRSVIDSPMSPAEFYAKLSPVIASVRDGHMRLLPPLRRLEKDETSLYQRFGTSPLVEFGYEIFDGKLYFTESNSADNRIKPGTELVELDGYNPLDLILKYRHLYTADGCNTTFFNRAAARDFPTIYSLEYGVKGSVDCRLRYNDSLSSVHLRFRNIFSRQIKADDNRLQPEILQNEINRVNGDVTKYRNLLLSPDNRLAIMKISTFTKSHRKFYRKSFILLDSLKTEFLILDLRDNFGGWLRDAYDLYSCLADTAFCFTEKFEVASRTSMLHTGYFRNKPLYMKALLVLFSPVRLAGMAVILSRIKKQDGRYLYTSVFSKERKPVPYHFKGEIFVLINGGTCSGASTLASGLKHSRRAVLIGEQAGGTSEGNIAGDIPSFRLPGSGLEFMLGLEKIVPYYRSEKDRCGITPDVEIIPALRHRLMMTDPELNWVLDELKEKHKKQ